jgi:general secretion pathway protein B
VVAAALAPVAGPATPARAASLPAVRSAPPAAPMRKAAAPPSPPVPAGEATRPGMAAKTPAKLQAAASASAAKPASAPEARIYTLNELPDEVRKDLPALEIGGAMYSKTPANRMLIVNGQVFHEGDTLAPGLSLEQINLKSAVLKLKGYRYGISF